jgi:uncharacterized membrane protein
MGWITTLLTFPVSLPVKGALWIGGQIHDAALAELNDPAAIRRALMVLEEQLEAGEIDEDTFEAREAVLIARLRAARREGRM